MAKIFIIATHGSEDPTRAGLAFFMAKGAIEAGHQPEILLARGRFRHRQKIGG